MTAWASRRECSPIWVKGCALVTPATSAVRDPRAILAFRALMATDNDPSDGTLPYAEIVVDARTTVPGDVFTYAAPPHLDLRPGHLVRVPFGSRSVHGVVLRLTSELRVDYVKPVRALVHAEPLLTAAQLDLAEWTARYYMAPAFDTIAPKHGTSL